MRLSTIFAILPTLGLVTAVALPDAQDYPLVHPLEPVETLAVFEIFSDLACKQPVGPQLVMTNETACWKIPGPAFRLRWIKPGFKYNALRVYKKDNCGGGWSLQPQNDACWEAGGWDNIQIVQHE